MTQYAFATSSIRSPPKLLVQYMLKISTFRLLLVTSGWLMTTDHAQACQLTYLTAFRLFYQKLKPNS